MKIVILSFWCLLLTTVLFSQEENDLNADQSKNKLTIDTSDIVGTSHLGLFTQRDNITSPHFNQGAISDISLLIQGKVAGLSIYNNGGDPNKMSLMQIRGINTMGPSFQPLMVVDGIVGVSLSNIDPNDIENIEVLKDAASCSRYGIRGALGVILIQTKKAIENTPTFSYLGQGAISQSLGTVNVLTADEYIQSGGLDLGSNTNWLKKISRQGFTTNHHFAAQVHKGNSGFRLSANYRDVQGVIKSTGFNQWNVRSNFNTALLNDKLKIDLNGSYTNRKSDLAIDDVVKSAVSTNPTMPVFGKDAIFPFSSDLYGGYFELLGLFEAYNPVSILNQSFRKSNTNNLNLNGNVRYQILNDLSFNIIYGYQNQQNDQDAFFPTTAYYKGIKYRNLNGLVESLVEDDKFTYLESTAAYRKKIKANTLLINVGYSHQQFNNNHEYVKLSGFNRAYAFDEFEQKIDTTQGKEYFLFSKSGPQEKLISFFASINYQIKDYLSFSGSVNRDGLSRLGVNNKWGFFPSISGALDISKLLKMQNTNYLIFKASYGITGNLPQGNGMSQKYEQQITLIDSTYTSVRWGPNPDLRWEEKSNTNVGIDFSKGKFYGSVNLYNSNISDLIQTKFDNQTFELRFQNQNKIQTRGIELSLNFKVIDHLKIKYTTGLQWSSYKSMLKQSEIKSMLVGAVEGNFGYILLQEGEEIGNIVGPIFEGVDGKGLPIYQDVNKDGTININPEYNENTDLAILGKGTPDLEIGWTNLINMGHWQFNAFFRGAFGHSMVNLNRARWEHEYTNLYNRVNTSKGVDGLKSRFFHSLYVEKADFIKLDNFTISRKIKLNNGAKKSNLLVSLTGHNLFILTGYTSGDPEPALNIESSSFETLTPTFLKPITSFNAPGLDLRSNYLTSRSFVLSVGLEF